LLKTFTLLIIVHLSLSASFQGVIVDKKTHKPVPDAMISDALHTVKSAKNGSFLIDGNATKYFVKAYGYRPFSFSSQSHSSRIVIEPITVKALYLTFWGASNSSQRLKNILEIIDNSEVNAIVVDVKNEYGLTSFATSFAQANSYGANKKRTNKNIAKFMQTMKSKHVYTIARIVTFKDDLQAINNHDYAVKTKNGIIWRNLDSMAWVDPFDKRAHNYTISIAEEAAKVGFDEINFDYIRFPAKKTLRFLKKNNSQNRVHAIESFLDEAKDRYP